MTVPFIALENLTYILPDGRTLFANVNARFACAKTGIVGRNGTGKSVLARLLAGELEPTVGKCERSGSVHYLAQQLILPAQATLADLAGVRSCTH